MSSVMCCNNAMTGTALCMIRLLYYYTWYKLVLSIKDKNNLRTAELWVDVERFRKII